MTPRPSTARPPLDTKARIFDAAEELFLEHGYDALSLRQITARADVNLAAVNYHFGSKEALVHAMLARRLDRLNVERLNLLDRFETSLGEDLTCEHVLGAMFLPAMRLARDPRVSGRSFLRLLGRAYGDMSPCIRDFLQAHYASVAERFFAAFARALPHLQTEELRWRLQFTMSAVSGVLAGARTAQLIESLSDGKPADDIHLVARLASLMVAALKAPGPDAEQIGSFMAVMHDADSILGESSRAAARSVSSGPATNASTGASIRPSGISRVAGVSQQSRPSQPGSPGCH